MSLFRTSEYLEKQSLYSRKELKSRFQINDASINNGIFLPDGHDSIWLFITAKKTRDRVQYVDVLDGPVLVMESQKQGRKDDLLRTHVSDNREILVFFREIKAQYPEYAFRFEGRFTYVHDIGEAPAHFVFRRVDEAPLLNRTR